MQGYPLVAKLSEKGSWAWTLGLLEAGDALVWVNHVCIKNRPIKVIRKMIEERPLKLVFARKIDPEKVWHV